MSRDALVVGINQYPFLKDTPTSKAKHLFTPANDAEAIDSSLFLVYWGRSNKQEINSA